MPQQLSLTRTTRAVLQVLLDGFEQDLWGLRICHETKLPSGTVYPLLTRLEDLGWIESRWEDAAADPARASGPRRRFYQLTPDGRTCTRTALAVPAEGARTPLVAVRPAAGAA